MTLKEIGKVGKYMVLKREGREENLLEDQSKQVEEDKRVLENGEI